MPTTIENNPSYLRGWRLQKKKKHSKTYQNEDPWPSWSSTDAIHVLNCGSKQPRKGARELRGNFSADDISLKNPQRTETAEKYRAILGGQCKDGRLSG